MATAGQPLSSAIIQSPLVDAKSGKLTSAGVQWVQTITRLANTQFDLQGNIQGPIGANASLTVRGVALADILAHLSNTGTFDSTDNIGDGTGSPLAGGKAAYAALITSAPAAGNILEYNGATWEPVAPSAAVGSLNGLSGAVTLVGSGGIVITPNSPAAGDIKIDGSGIASSYIKGSVAVAAGGAMSGTFKGSAAVAGATTAMAAIASCPTLIGTCGTNPVSWAADVLSANTVEVQVTLPNIGVGWATLTFSVVVFP